MALLKIEQCTCIEKILPQLREKYANDFDWANMISFKTGDTWTELRIATRKIHSGDRKHKKMTIRCQYCPFCGVKYLEDPKDTAAIGSP